MKQTDRDTTIRRLRSLFSEGVRHKVYKFDISSFYESVETAELLEMLERDPRITRLTFHLARCFLEFFEQNGFPGLPRGIGLSAALAEYAMQDFDTFVEEHTNVYFYARYVDDIVIVTSMEENSESFERDLTARLLDGLTFNFNKSDSWPP